MKSSLWLNFSNLDLMKKLILLLLFIPLVSFGQIIKSKTYGEIDIRNIEDKYISVEYGFGAFTQNHYLTTSEYREAFIAGNIRKKKWNVYDEGELKALPAQVDLLNFFDKYGWGLVKTDVESNGAVTNYYNNINMAFTSESTTITLVFTRK